MSSWRHILAKSLEGGLANGIITCSFLHLTGRSKCTIRTGSVMLNLKMSLWRLRDQFFWHDQLFILLSSLLLPHLQSYKHFREARQQVKTCRQVATARCPQTRKQLPHWYHMSGRISLKYRAMHVDMLNAQSTQETCCLSTRNPGVKAF